MSHVTCHGSLLPLNFVVVWSRAVWQFGEIFLNTVRRDREDLLADPFEVGVEEDISLSPFVVHATTPTRSAEISFNLRGGTLATDPLPHDVAHVGEGRLPPFLPELCQLVEREFLLLGSVQSGGPHNRSGPHNRTV